MYNKCVTDNRFQIRISLCVFLLLISAIFLTLIFLYYDSTNNLFSSSEQHYTASSTVSTEEIIYDTIFPQRSHMVLFPGFMLAILGSVIAYLISNKQALKLQGLMIPDDFDTQQKKIREKEAILDTIIHDLKAPLNNILSMNELIGEMGELNDRQLEFLGYSRSEAFNGINMIDNMLTISELEQQNTATLFHSFDLHLFIDEILMGYTQQAQKKGIRLKISLPDEKIIFESEILSLKRILDNLVSNALKYTCPGKKVSIIIRKTKSHLCFYVKDEGQGILKEELPRLFTKFGKLSSRPTGKEKSSGLGLYTVKLLAARINTEISVSSRWGKGSTFSLKLPLKQ